MQKNIKNQHRSWTWRHYLPALRLSVHPTVCRVNKFLLDWNIERNKEDSNNEEFYFCSSLASHTHQDFNFCEFPRNCSSGNYLFGQLSIGPIVRRLIVIQPIVLYSYQKQIKQVAQSLVGSWWTGNNFKVRWNNKVTRLFKMDALGSIIVTLRMVFGLEEVMYNVVVEREGQPTHLENQLRKLGIFRNEY